VSIRVLSFSRYLHVGCAAAKILASVQDRLYSTAQVTYEQDTPQLVYSNSDPIPERDIRIRKSCHSDLEEVSNLLALASVPCYDNKVKNWNVAIEFKREKSIFYKQILQRFKAIEEGIHAHSEIFSDQESGRVTRFSDDYRTRLWRKEKFRRCLERAATVSSERSYWNTHDFSIVPKNTYALQHVMMTAEDMNEKNVVGFCELAPLQIPFNTNVGHSNKVVQYPPVIANLVVARSHRRMGIATSMVNTAQRYVSAKWDIPTSCDEFTIQSRVLGLFVNHKNKAAVSLYRKNGFSLENAVKINHDLVYFQKEL